MKEKATRLKIRSKVPFPPTRVFKDKKKERQKKVCRGNLPLQVFTKNII